MRSTMRITWAIACFMLYASGINAQIWTTMGNGVIQYTTADSHSTVESNNMYFCRGYRSTSGNNPITIYKWNGLSWSSLAGPNIPGSLFIQDIEVLNGEIYLPVWVGSSNSVNLYHYDGTTWSILTPPGLNGDIQLVKRHNGTLLVAGPFTANGGIDRIASYDPAIGFSSLPSFPIGFNSVDEIYIFNNNLFVSDTISQASSILQLNGSTWSQPFSSVVGTPPSTLQHGFKFFENQGVLHCVEKFGANMYALSGSTMTFKGTIPFNIMEYSPIAELNGLTFVSNGSNLFYSYDGSTLSNITTHPYGIRLMEKLNGKIGVFAGDTLFNQIKHPHTFFLELGSSVIQGETYNDQNGDCSKNSGEPLIHPVAISLTGNNGVVGVSNDHGQYNSSIPPGTYNLSVSTNFSPAYKNMAVNCTLPTSITVGANQTITQDIPLSNSVSNDLIITITSPRGFRARHGDTVLYDVKVTNAGTSVQSNVPFTVTLPSTVSLQSTNPNPASQSNNTLNYVLASIQPYQSIDFQFRVRIEPTMNQIMDVLSFAADVSAFSQDADLSDNVDSLRQTVVGAYDPNDKQASDYRILPQTNNIDYHIRFQNTGNDTAYKVIVVDTLDLTLPLTSVRINSASHPYSLSVVNNVLIWEFDRIMLPDSTTDLAGSQGYVNFSTRITPGLQVGDSIRNRADIFFDFQPPIKTNFAVTSVVQFLGTLDPGKVKTDLRIYPNPASDKLYLETKSDSDQTFLLFNLQGQKVQEIQVPRSGKTSINVTQLAKGMYILTNGLESYKLIIE